MPSEKPRPMLADYVAIVMSPGLIMTLILSLIYFLIEVLYVGDFLGRLQWIFFFYIFGAVLVARISMLSEIAERAPLYGSVLAFLVWIGLGQFVDYPPGWEGLSWVVNAGLVGLVWWSSYRLTWDCTYVDEEGEGSGAGLLHAAGLEGGVESKDQAPVVPEPRRRRNDELSWLERYRRYREVQKKNHTPGVWVVYFALATLPIFGLGQSLIPVEETARRSFAFWMMAVYAASVLGLLVTTAFLTLRRYLRQRGLQMPGRVTVAWLSGGAGLSLCLLVVAAILPRPEAEFGLLSLTPFGSRERDASRFAQTQGDPGKGEGNAGAQQHDEKEGKSVDSGQKDKKGGGGKGSAKGQGQGEKNSDQGGKSQDKGGKGNSEKGNEAKPDGKKTQADAKKDDSSKGNEDQKGQGNTEKQDSTRANKDAKSARGAGNRSQNRSTWSPPPVLAGAARVLKWIVFALIALAAIVFMLRGGLRYLANFFDSVKRFLEALRRLWEGLFGRRPDQGTEVESGEVAEPRRSVRPFRVFSNPFEDGRSDSMSPGELVHYSFEALEAWAAERDLGRREDETPIEFARRLGEEVPSLEKEVERLATLFARVLYARGGLPSTARSVVQGFWTKLERLREGALSA